MESLKELVGKKVLVITLEGRSLVGTLKGHDHVYNIILESCVERIFSTDAGMAEEDLGLYVVRGDSVGVIGEVNTEADAEIDWSTVHAAQPSAIVHGVA